MQFFAPLEQGLVPFARRQVHTSLDEPLHVAGGSMQPFSDSTEDSRMQNCDAVQLEHGSPPPAPPASP